MEDLLGEINVLPFEIPSDAEYGGIRSEREAAGKPIGGNDLPIAAHASATIVAASVPTLTIVSVIPGSPNAAPRNDAERA